MRGLGLALLVVAVVALAGEPDAGAAACALDVTVSKLRDGGSVWVLLFDDPAGYPTRRDKALRRIDATPVDGGVAVAFEGLTCARDYAVAVVHDENGNGEMDRWFLGPPREGVGASRDAKGFIGPPPFEAAKLRLTQPRVSAPIIIRY